MQANSQTVIRVTNGVLTVESTERYVGAINLILDLAKKSLLEQGRSDGLIETATPNHVAELLTNGHN